MSNILKSKNDVSATISDTLSDATKQSMREVASNGQSVVDKGKKAALDLQHSSAVRYVRDNPVKVAGLAFLGGLVIYSIFKRTNKDSE